MNIYARVAKRCESKSSRLSTVFYYSKDSKVNEVLLYGLWDAINRIESDEFLMSQVATA